MQKHSRKPWLALIVIVVVGGTVAALAATTGRASAAGHGAMVPAVSGNPKALNDAQQVAGPSGSVHFTCQLTTPASCYGPDQIRAAYGVQPLLNHGINGAGRTIVIIDAYGSPTLAADLHTWDTLWGLPDPTLNIIAPDGVAATDPGNAFGWGVETSLDVEWAHAIAPAATIDLVVAKSNSDADILSATKYAVDHSLGDVVSQSFGEAEQCMDPALVEQQHRLFGRASEKGITLLASSGDQGAGIFTCDGSAYFKAVSTPASDPLVTAVGGTSLQADGVSGAYQNETVWNESAIFGDAVASGGGISTLYRRPDYQAPVVKNSRMREIPDVAYNAGVLTGVIVRAFCVVAARPSCVTDHSTYFRVGGTSAGSPQWAGLVALADQVANGRVGGLNKTLYKLGRSGSASTYFHDITVGDNSIPDLTPFLGAAFGTPIAGFPAVPGYDMSTGWGSPIANALVPRLGQQGDGGGNGGGDNGGGDNGGGGDNSNGGGGNGNGDNGGGSQNH